MKKQIFIIGMLISNLVFSQYSLSIKYQRQIESEWCWAASCAMIINYKLNTNYSQCEIVDFIAHQNYSGNYDCCSTPDYCNSPAYSTAINRALKSYGVSITEYGRALSYNEVVSIIDAGNPIGVSLQSTRGGHEVVLIGYGYYRMPTRMPPYYIDYPTYHVLDPIMGDQWVYANVLTYSYNNLYWADSFVPY